MRRLVLLVLLALPLMAARADALTVKDVIELSRAGLGEDVLIALIEVDPSVFAIDTATLRSLKEAGVSQKVIIAMIRSGRTPPPAAPAPVPDVTPEPPQVVFVDRPQPAPVVEVPVPVYVPIYPTVYPNLYPTGRVHQVSPYTSGSSTRFMPTTGLSAPPPLPTTEINWNRIAVTTVPHPKPEAPSNPKKGS